MKEYIQVITTTHTKESAEEIANTLVENRHAACVQIVGPITSIYWWKEKIERTTEWVCIAKTRRDLYSGVESTIHQIHPYEIPEILAVPIVEGSQNYFSWIDRILGE